MSKQPVWAANDERPFIGLRSFAFIDRKFFFGRELQIGALRQLLERGGLIAVVGSSGSGKSSLVRAGLLGRLADETSAGAQAWLWTEFRPGSEPIRRLARALAGLDDSMGPVPPPHDLLGEARAERIELHLRASSFGLREALSHVPELRERRLLLLIDQFEELFRFDDPQMMDPCRVERRDEASRFVQLLLEATQDPDPGLVVLLTMRSDFIGDCARFHGLAEAVNARQYLVPGLTRDQLECAICGPLEHAAGEIEPELVETLLDDATDEPDQLPVLQHVLMCTWDEVCGRRERQPLLTLRDYEIAGGWEGALSQHANRILNELVVRDASLGPIVEAIFKALTTIDREGRATRQPRMWAELATVVTPANAREARKAEARNWLNLVLDRFRALDCSFLVPS